ncbi:hypothetical protein CFIMG_005021RAa [Ceratocystis fimbriata CBS 114723]|uniref:Uncharacterized protein n=1 Tax=Ceratocystis fimbriata CBS 114723 TaxID=1035309 RepID=A0A2C5WM00_9PEZI|nr:hypothetical protein CFIMG_005021RAa [Ceratocystis fimbriata CBS 114723]
MSLGLTPPQPFLSTAAPETSHSLRVMHNMSPKLASMPGFRGPTVPTSELGKTPLDMSYKHAPAETFHNQGMAYNYMIKASDGWTRT